MLLLNTIIIRYCTLYAGSRSPYIIIYCAHIIIYFVRVPFLERAHRYRWRARSARRRLDPSPNDIDLRAPARHRRRFSAQRLSYTLFFVLFIYYYYFSKHPATTTAQRFPGIADRISVNNSGTNILLYQTVAFKSRRTLLHVWAFLWFNRLFFHKVTTKYNSNVALSREQMIVILSTL